jgi:hypothetical protein
MVSNTMILRRYYLYSPIIDVISPLVVTLDGLPVLLSNGIAIVFL